MTSVRTIRRGTAPALRAVTMAVVLGAALAGLGPAPAAAVQEFPASPSHRGVAAFDPYRIFPENRPGNGVYFENRLLMTLAGETVRHVAALPKPGRFAYLAVDGKGAARVGVFLQAQDKQIRLSDAGSGFFHAIFTLDGVVYKKLFRVKEDREVLDLLPASKTPDGPLPGERGLAFYHVANVLDPDPTAGNVVKQFGMQLHLAPYNEERVRHYAFTIYNTLPQLTLTWESPDRISYRLENGLGQTLNLSQFQ